MSDHRSSSTKKRKKKSHHNDNDDDYDGPKKKSLVDYSKVSGAQPASGIAARRSGPEARHPSANMSTASAPAAGQPRMSAQMEAVVRLMAGVEERTIAQKLADSNRPTWEQYKKDNSDKLNLEGVDQKQMEAYRQELDKERDSRLARGTNHGSSSKRKKKKKRRDDDSSDSSDSNSDSSEDRHRKRKHKKKKHKKSRKHKRRDDDSSEDGDSSTSDRKRSSKKHKKKKSKSKSNRGDGNESDESNGDHYRLSQFFNAG